MNRFAHKKSLGQNFLKSSVVVGRILQAAEGFLSRTFALVEIGPGEGALTHQLLNLAQDRPFYIVELDHRLVGHWGSVVAEKSNVHVIEADALKVEWDALDISRPALLVSNLPYQISASLVLELSCEYSAFDFMVLMFQKEVAERIAARPSTPQYGMLSVISQLFWNVERVCDAGPKDFVPPPKVASRVLKFEKKDVAVQIKRSDFLLFEKLSWSQRRKKLASNLSQKFVNQKVVESFEKLGLKPSARAEELTPKEHLQLFLSLDPR